MKGYKKGRKKHKFIVRNSFEAFNVESLGKIPMAIAIAAMTLICTIIVIGQPTSPTSAQTRRLTFRMCWKKNRLTRLLLLQPSIQTVGLFKATNSHSWIGCIYIGLFRFDIAVMVMIDFGDYSYSADLVGDSILLFEELSTVAQFNIGGRGMFGSRVDHDLVLQIRAL